MVGRPLSVDDDEFVARLGTAIDDSDERAAGGWTVAVEVGADVCRSVARCVDVDERLCPCSEISESELDEVVLRACMLRFVLDEMTPAEDKEDVRFDQRFSARLLAL